ncbi:MAG: hypothetical protein GF344_19390 [Chitinivibrionales bacterium]|nr:hypothetical protein [Chitinivibrionales bacterium]MBD3358789.1 hypothetical protein [Chitinivibrionales bacterium]
MTRRHAPEIAELEHEPQVHQMESEMMVEEFMSSWSHLARTQGLYRELYENAPP